MISLFGTFIHHSNTQLTKYGFNSLLIFTIYHHELVNVPKHIYIHIAYCNIIGKLDVCVCVFILRYGRLWFDLVFIKMDVLHDDSLQVNEKRVCVFMCRPHLCAWHRQRLQKCRACTECEADLRACMRGCVHQEFPSKKLGAHSRPVVGRVRRNAINKNSCNIFTGWQKKKSEREFLLKFVCFVNLCTVI